MFWFRNKTGKYTFLGAMLCGVLLTGSNAQAYDLQSAVSKYGAEPIPPEVLARYPEPQLTRAYIPDAVDMSKRMPPPMKQTIGNCVASSVGYALRGYYAGLEKGDVQDFDSIAPSVAQFHNIIRFRDGPCDDSGSNLTRAMEALEKVTLSSRAQVPDDQVCKDGIVPLATDTGQFRILGHDLLARRDQSGRIPRYQLDVMKLSLANGHPIAVAMDLPGLPPSKGGKENPNTTVLDLLQQNEVYKGSTGPHGPVVGGHAMVFVGYDERRQAFLVQNSWGKGWAGNGFGWIGYDAVIADLQSALVMKTRNVPPKPFLGSDQPSGEGEGNYFCSRIVSSGKKLVKDKFAAVRYTGFVASEVDRLEFLISKSSTLSSMVSDIKVRPWPVCEALLSLTEPLGASDRPKVHLLSDATEVAFGQSLAFEVTTPNFPAFVYLVYLQADGSVVNLVPRVGPIRKQYPPHSVLTFGDGKDGRQRFTAVAPAGAEAIIAIAARSPIFQLEELENSDDGGQYTLPEWSMPDGDEGMGDRQFLTALRAGMEERPEADENVLAREISADVLHITIKETEE